MVFTKILEKTTNEELEKLFNIVMALNFIGEWDYLAISVSNTFTREVEKRLSNGTLKKETSKFPTDWELFVNCCKG